MNLLFINVFAAPFTVRSNDWNSSVKFGGALKSLMLLSRIFIIMGSVICPEITSIISKPGWSCGSWRFARSSSIYGITILSSNLNDSGVFYSIAFHFWLNESGSLTREILLLVFPQKISCIGRNLFSHLMPNVAVITCLNYSHVFWFFR